MTDSDGATDSSQATLSVNKAKDYPPEANAGPNQVRTAASVLFGPDRFRTQPAVLLLPGHPAAEELHHAVRQPKHRRPRQPVLRVVAEPREQRQGGGDAGEVLQRRRLLCGSGVARLTVFCRRPGRPDADPAAVGHAGGRLHLPADGDGFCRAAGHVEGHRHRAAGSEPPRSRYT